MKVADNDGLLDVRVDFLRRRIERQQPRDRGESVVGSATGWAGSVQCRIPPDVVWQTVQTYDA